MLCSVRRGPLLAFRGIGDRRLPHPGALVMGLASSGKPIAVAWAIAGEHLIEFFPVDRTVNPMTGFILLHAGIGYSQPQEPRLRHGGVDEFLAQLVVGETLDLPPGGGVAVLARLV